MSSNNLPEAEDANAAIRQLHQQRATLQLVRPFKGALLMGNAEVLEVNPDHVVLRSGDARLCAALEAHVFLHSRFLYRPIKAYLKASNPHTGLLTIHGIQYCDVEWRERQHERVRPKSPTYATVHCKGKELRASIDDISVQGMALLAYKVYERGIEIQPGSSLHVNFLLPPDQPFALKGKVIYIHPLGKRMVRSGIFFHPRARETRTLEKYVAQRKQELLDELDKALLESKRPPGVENLYF